jgi:hypothetical protein
MREPTHEETEQLKYFDRCWNELRQLERQAPAGWLANNIASIIFDARGQIEEEKTRFKQRK